MTHITLTPDLATRLNALDHPVELCDPSGQIIGRFIPKFNEAEWEPMTPDVTEEELDRRAQSDEKRYTTAEVLSHLEKQ